MLTVTHQQDFPGGQTLKNLPAVQETQVQSLGWVNPLENGMATYSSSLVGYSLRSCKESDKTERLTVSLSTHEQAK